MKIITKSAEETIRHGEKFAHKLKGGEVILLDGDLGSGKTTFVKGMARGLGIKRNVTSPTFVIMKAYSLKLPNRGLKHFVHIDMYRVGAKALEDIGVFEFFGRDDIICVVEWGRKLRGYLSAAGVAVKEIKIQPCGENIRQFNINHYGHRQDRGKKIQI